MKVTRIKKLMISGISVVTNNEFEMSEENGKIAGLWEEYFQKDIYKKTFDKVRQPSQMCFRGRIGWLKGGTGFLDIDDTGDPADRQTELQILLPEKDV